MKKTLKLLFLGSFPLFIVIIIFSCLNVIKTDFKYAHQSFFTYQEPFDWLLYKIKTNTTKSLIAYKKKREIGLPIKHIYIKEKFQKELLENTPSSTKKWKDGLLINNDGSTDKIEIRLRGDNPENWLFEKKNWKIKKRKKKTTNRQRYFEYHPFDVEVYFSGKLAKAFGLLTPDLDIVELFINEKSQGIHTETQTLNEGFLRRNKIMPVNIYKGELILAESIIQLENNLLNSPGALKKIAYFNQVTKNNKSDLKHLSRTLQLAHNNQESYLRLMELIDLNYWSKFTSYQILTQNFHNDYSHNFRMISDPWSGKFTPIVYDPIINVNIEKKDIDFNHSSNELFLLLNQSSHFQNLKFEYINHVLNSEIIKNEIIDINQLDDAIKISEGRDVEILSNDFDLIKLILNIFNNKNRSNITYKHKEKLIKKFLVHNNNINNFLKSKPEANWYKSQNGFEIYVHGEIPISDISLSFEGKKPNWIVLDLNENGKFDKNEFKFSLNNEGNFKIPYRFYANRIPYANEITDLGRPKIKILSTKFKFISENKNIPIKIKYKNPFSDKEYKLKYEKYSSYPLSNNNTPIYSYKNLKNNIKDKIILEGIINIDKTKVYKDSVEIKPGTIFEISNGASIIFKEKLIALGTKKEPIFFKKGGVLEWGTIALQGNGTKKSRLKNIVFDGGSGDISGHIKYTGALSIQDTNDIIIKNILMKNNSNFDDMLHIVYVDNIKLDNINIENSNMDAIDVDMSKNVEIINTKINQSGNDGIDLMESDAVISNVKIMNSSDKAISVGENSVMILNNSLISKNNIGVATKDKSISFIINSNLINNEVSLNNYKKNWQYSGGGLTKVYRSKLSNKKNVSIDKHSAIKIFDSKLDNLNLKEKVILKKKNKSNFSLLNSNDYKTIVKKLINKNILVIDDINYIGSKNQ